MFLKTILFALTVTILIQEYEAIATICNLPIVSGNGQEEHIRWAYSIITHVCVSFRYTGKGGNRNNFFTERECRSYCYF
uniref:DTX protein n=1 Tax=Eumenes pomiformis TaxID=693051 RepID=D1MEJ4_EUMPO|nr:DTX protein precursor [Eumenes pomiformis]